MLVATIVVCVMTSIMEVVIVVIVPGDIMGILINPMVVKVSPPILTNFVSCVIVLMSVAHCTFNKLAIITYLV